MAIYQDISKSNQQDGETIAAIATAMSDAGIGIIRISGPSAVSYADRLCVNAKGEHKVADQPTHTIRLYHVVDEAGAGVDEALVSVMRAPHSYTGEDVAEINCHGGMQVMQKVLRLLLAQGCRLAEPGEFTKRAFLNGRMDLTQAEAVMDLIHAQNEFALRNSERELQGQLRQKVTKLRKPILYRMAFIESALDDPENYDMEGTSEEILKEFHGLAQQMQSMLSTSGEGRLLADGIRTVIVGKPNAGKSSLLNLLCGSERAIVTEIPGTTRDTLEETVRLGDVTLRVMDTAGIRSTSDPIETMGVQKAYACADSADLILYMLDAHSEQDQDDLDLFQRMKRLSQQPKLVILLNKTDLLSSGSEDQVEKIESAVRTGFSIEEDGEPDTIPMIPVSMKDADSLNQIRDVVSGLFFEGSIAQKEEVYLTNLRQETALREAADSMQMVIKTLEDGLSEDLCLVDLMNCYRKLGEIIGQEVGDDLVEEIFSRFCMGK